MTCNSTMRKTLAFALLLVGLGACVTETQHRVSMDAALASKKNALADAEAAHKAAQDETIAEKERVAAELARRDQELNDALLQNQKLADKVSSMGQNVEALLGEKSAMAQKQEQLQAAQSELAKEVEDLRRLRAAAEARNKEFAKLQEKLRGMIDAGTLSVRIRNGRMLVEMASDVVFPPGSTEIKEKAQKAIQELSQTIASFKNRKFQVVGHSDSTPIRTERFPSNWELSSARANEVVKLMIAAGVQPQNISAAGQAEFDPLVANKTNKQKAKNRRVEIVFVPNLNELPGVAGANL